jgi:CRP/FNR family cyclic AMP-dependent transcriptional regulator
MKTKMMTSSEKNLGPKQTKVKSARKRSNSADWDRFLTGVTRGKTAVEYGLNHAIFKRGEPADSVFYIRDGKVKLAATSKLGKEAIVAVLNGGEFFGEGCLGGQLLRTVTATAMMDSTLHRIEKPLMMRMLHDDLDISEFFAEHLLSRNIRYESDLVDQLFNSSEKRLARILLLLARFGKESRFEPVLPKINQATLADMVSTTRSKISHFMNQFKKHGFVNYNGGGEMTVHSGLLSVVLGSLSDKTREPTKPTSEL